mgnify:FL=1
MGSRAVVIRSYVLSLEMCREWITPSYICFYYSDVGVCGVAS